jgi:hypothetical protein
MRQPHLTVIVMDHDESTTLLERLGTSSTAGCARATRSSTFAVSSRASCISGPVPLQDSYSRRAALYGVPLRRTRRGQSDLERSLVGSVARAVLYHASCSVLIVPEPQASPGGDRE